MPFDETLALLLRRALAARRGVTEQKMFGGLCFLLNGNMLCGVDRSRLMFRVGKEAYADALSRPEASPMDFTGRPLVGFVFVDPTQCGVRGIASWVSLAERYVDGLPPKAKTERARV